jgi:hypothetical protein
MTIRQFLRRMAALPTHRPQPWHHDIDGGCEPTNGVVRQMVFQSRLLRTVAAIASVLVFSSAFAASDRTNNLPQTKAATFSFGGMNYMHRWSKGDQNEYTPESDSDLGRWHDMVTINVHEAVRNGDQLADIANRVLSNYQSHGKIVRTDSQPRTSQHPAEHLIVAVLGNPTFLEAAFARLALIDGVGVVVVYSHRVYGKDAAGTIGEWVKTNGPSVEKTLMAWDKMPTLAALKQLPQSK